MNYNGFKECFSEQGITLYLGDCMRLLEQSPDKCYDLCICDPPYGVGMDGGNVGYKGFNDFQKKGWDNATPSQEYFDGLRRVTTHQIIFGGNYFTLPPSRGFVVWDKGEGFYNRTYAECEMAWVSMDCNAKIFKHDPLANGDYKGKIHPTQKPTALYRFILQNYARPGQTILDTHLGSGSSAIAAWEMGYTFTGIEIDEDYYHAAVERFKKRIAQPYLPGLVQPAKPRQDSLL